MAATEDNSADRLQAYRAKRAAERTPEPVGTVSRAPGHLFVFHQHAARRLHWDLRLEMHGVLMSWAVPKGPSNNPEDKRLAVHVEDHPVEYGDFEGTIPEGNYGAGAVIVWDRGVWVPIGDPDEGMAKGKLLFELKGYKCKGTWTLVKLKKEEKEWLLIKERDAYAVWDDHEFPAGSVWSGLTVEQLASGADPAAELVPALEEAGAVSGPVAPRDVGIMLAETAPRPFSDPDWVFELKLDGYRIIAGRRDGIVQLLTRNGHDVTGSFPEIAKAVGALPYEGLVLDGELIGLDDRGRPSFQRLQQRAKLTRPLEIKRASLEAPTTFFAFDLLGFGEFDLRPLPLVERKTFLRRILPTVGAVPYVEHFEEEGEALFERVRDLRLEGIVAKKAASPYRAGRSADWLKVRADLIDDFVVVGFSEPKGSRGGFGALHLADYVDGELTYAGRVGSGFSGEMLEEVRSTLDDLTRDTPACAGPVPKGEEHHWVEPKLMCEVRYKEWTDERVLRQPVFLTFRDDKPLEECIRHISRPALDEPATLETTAPVERVVRYSNLDKVFWPEEGYTKGDLIEFYRVVAPWALPFLRDRPVVLTRFPDGIDGKSFFQKDAPKFVPEWVRLERMWSEESQREILYFVADNVESLLYIANMGTIPLHLWASRIETLERPDWVILDLDPKEAPFRDVVTLARAAHDLCADVVIPSYVKTSGSSGLHVLMPLGRLCTYEQAKAIGELFARILAAEHPDIATVTRRPSSREGKVYVDFLQNGRGKLVVAPYSVRPLPGAPVSTPLAWDEVDDSLDIGHFTIATVPRRLQTLGRRLMEPVISETPDLGSVLEALTERLSA
jgi:bifunctional non-homologous end joining protein LigD